jgi:very-short-patch-repair endonuclease
LITQYGCSGYWIDYAAQHPTRPGQMVLAIECDGASYHSSATARDRDRLRQEHLERLGWTFHRIWSQDWFYHREAETDRALAAYRAAVTAADQSESRPAPSGTPQRQDAAPDPAPDLIDPARRAGPCPVPTRRGSIGEYSLADLTAVVRWIESDTLLRTEDELLAEAVRALGFGRRGSKITAAITAAIAQARRPTHQQPSSTPAGMIRRDTPPPQSQRRR